MRTTLGSQMFNKEKSKKQLFLPELRKSSIQDNNIEINDDDPEIKEVFDKFDVDSIKYFEKM